MYCLYRFLFKKIPYSKSAHNVNQNIKSSIAKGVSNQNGQSMSGIHGDGGLQNQHCVCSLVCVIKQIHQYVMWLRDFVFSPPLKFRHLYTGIEYVLVRTPSHGKFDEHFRIWGIFYKLFLWDSYNSKNCIKNSNTY